MKKNTPNQKKKAAQKAAKKKDVEFVKQVRAASKASRASKSSPAVLSPAQPRYNDGVTRFNQGARYVTDDPTPVPGKAKVALGLNKRSDDNLIGFGHSHDDAIDQNPKFPTPEPAPAAFEAALAAYEMKVSEIENHRITGKNLTEQRDVLRAAFEQFFTLRGDYVQTTSQGDGDWIASAGLPVKNGPTPTGILPSPLALRVDLNGEAGVMVIKWDPVTGAKSYMLEVAEVVDNVAVGWSLLYMGGKFSTRQTGMTVGKTYAFRVAAVGGEGGMSEFSPEVWRAAA